MAVAISADGTSIGYRSLGTGPSLLVVGGVLSDSSDYLPLARRLARQFTVHVVDRRGRRLSGPLRPGHSIEDECADLRAVAEATGARAVFGHSFGGLVSLEAARRRPALQRVFVYEPGVPLRGRLQLGWLDGYQQRLEAGDRRGAFAWMVKHNGFAPRALAIMPLWYVRAALRIAIRQSRWEPMDRLLEANLVEHRIEAALDGPSAERFSTVTAATVLMAGAKSPASIGGELVTELGGVIPDSKVTIFPGLDHLAPMEHPGEIAAAVLAPSR